MTHNAHAIGADPWQHWRTADSTHFRIHFRTTQRITAEQIAAIAERVYPRITQQLEWEPKNRIEVILFNESDLTNGFATPQPFNTLGIFLSPPDEGELLENSSWLELVTVHELTHIIHLDKTRGIPHVLKHILGRTFLSFPNAMQPSWAIEGLAVYNESEPEQGRGRLRSPYFEAWLRAQRAQGFLSLAEINADGRSLPLSKQYLYGAYFYDFLERTYGKQAVYKYIQRYSGNIVPRVYTNPVAATGKRMDVLWREFLADLSQQLDTRYAQLIQSPEQVGTPLISTQWSIDSLAPAADAAVYAVIDNGLTQPTLQKITRNGRTETLTTLNFGARIDARGTAEVLLTQPEICRNRALFYDVYLYTHNKLKRLTHCAHLRRAIFAGNHLLALQNHAGTTQLVRLDHTGHALEILYTPADPSSELTDLAATQDGLHAVVTEKRQGRWALLEFALDASAPSPVVRLMWESPIIAPRYHDDSVQFIAAQDGVLNIWQHPAGSEQVQRLTQTHTAVLTQAIGIDGALTLATLTSQGAQLTRLEAPDALQTTDLKQPPTSIAQETTVPRLPLTNEHTYQSWRSVYPRAWFPEFYADHGLTAYGATTFGTDALNWHQYFVTALWETSQHEPMGSMVYSAYGRHYFALTRKLSAVFWDDDNGRDHTTVFERRTHGQWISTLPWLQLRQRLTLGIGASFDHANLVVVDSISSNFLDQKLAATYLEFDNQQGNWLSEGRNEGVNARLLYETYKLFSNDYDGTVLRFDGTAYLPLGRTVLASSATEIHATGRTEPYQLGGAIPLFPLGVPTLGERDLPLRGYTGDEFVLRGRHARRATLEWRTPLLDIDRHTMVPPIGINRLSATVFFDVGAAWNTGAPEHYYRGAGVELLGEVNFIYIINLQLRAGVARGLDEPISTQSYLTLGRQF